MSKIRHYLIPHHTNNQRAKFLHPKGILGITVFLFGIQILVRSLTASFPLVLGVTSTIDPNQIIKLTNDQRYKNGQSAVVENPLLSQAAMQKASDMFAKDYWAHVSPQGTQPWYFISNSGYSYRYAGENLARDFTSPESVVNAWMNSPSHRQNLLSPKYQEIGVAVLEGKLKGRDTILVVQMFGTQISSQNSHSSDQNFSKTGVISEVRAIESSEAPSSNESKNSLISHNSNKFIALGIICFLIFVLVLDIFIVWKKNLVRWTSKSLAHLIFLCFMSFAISLILKGQLL